MTSLEDLKTELASAIERLEQAAATAGPGGDSDKLVQHRDALIAEVSKLKGENIRLKKELAAAEKQHTALQKTSNRAAERVDSVIADIQNVLGG